MRIDTKFNRGDEIFIIDNNTIVKRRVEKVIVEQSQFDCNSLIVYHFDTRNLQSCYRYESEVGGSVAELVTALVGVTVDDKTEVKNLRSFIETCAKDFDCDSDAHKYQTFCRKCEADKLIVESHKQSDDIRNRKGPCLN